MLKQSNSLSRFSFDFKPRSYICNLSLADLYKGLYSCKRFIGFTDNDYLCMSGIILRSCVTYKGLIRFHLKFHIVLTCRMKMDLELYNRI